MFRKKRPNEQRVRDILSVLEHMASGKNQTLRPMSAEVGVPYSTLRRMITPACFENRPYTIQHLKFLLGKRKFMNRDWVVFDTTTIRKNLSRYDEFLEVAMENNYRVIPLPTIGAQLNAKRPMKFTVYLDYGSESRLCGASYSLGSLDTTCCVQQTWFYCTSHGPFSARELCKNATMCPKCGSPLLKGKSEEEVYQLLADNEIKER